MRCPSVMFPFINHSCNLNLDQILRILIWLMMSWNPGLVSDQTRDGDTNLEVDSGSFFFPSSISITSWTLGVNQPSDEYWLVGRNSSAILWQRIFNSHCSEWKIKVSTIELSLRTPGTFHVLVHPQALFESRIRQKLFSPVRSRDRIWLKCVRTVSKHFSNKRIIVVYTHVVVLVFTTPPENVHAHLTSQKSKSSLTKWRVWLFIHPCKVLQVFPPHHCVSRLCIPRTATISIIY